MAGLDDFAPDRPVLLSRRLLSITDPRHTLPMITKSSSPAHHIYELQSLRGIAALVVLLHHCSFTFETTSAWKYFAELLLNAHAAVIVFFVLSGYVLCKSLGLQGSISIWRFYIKRGFRIYPLVWLAVAISVLYLASLHFSVPTVTPSSWFVARYPSALPDLVTIGKNLAAIQTTIVPPMGSVRVELIESMLLPFLWLAVRAGYGTILLLVCAFFSLVWASHPLVGYTYAFVVGAFVLQHEARWSDWAGQTWVGIASVVMLLFFRRLDQSWSFEINYNAVVPTLVEATAAGVLILFLATRNGGVAWARARTLIFLGDISFGVYLFHFPVMAAMAKLPILHSVSADFASLLLMLLTLIVTIPLSALTYKFVELPGIAAGRLLLSKAADHDRRAPHLSAQEQLPKCSVQTD